MDDDHSFLTPALLSQVAAEFSWPDSYTIVDDAPDGILMVFPRCGLIFRDGTYGGVDVDFFLEHTNTESSLGVFEAMLVIVPEDQRIDGEIPGLEDVPSTTSIASLQETTNGIRRVCTILTRFLIPVIEGDFTWIGKYRQMYPDHVI